MVPRAATSKNPPLALVLSGAFVVLAVVLISFYLQRPSPEKAQNGPASAEAKSYVSNLVLSDVSMKAAENFMQQQVVDIEGRITNNGPRAIESVDVYCLFRGMDGREIYRERVPIVRPKAAPVKPKETRPFRLAFDELPDGWNQSMPTLVIAQISFAH
jgi:hypothetical protein